MNGFVRYLAIISVPVILMVQFYQGYRYTITWQQGQELKELQEVYFEENRKILAGITVYSAPERIYRVAMEILGLKKIESDRRLLINFPEGGFEQGVTFRNDRPLAGVQDDGGNVSFVQIPEDGGTELFDD